MCEHCGCGHQDDTEAHEHTHEHGVETIHLEQDVLAHNRAQAEAFRRQLAETGVKLVNVIGGPGCGKTELLSGLIPLLTERHPCAVIEGDLATENDAERIRKTGVPVYQIQTGTACHLSTRSVEHAAHHLPLETDGLLFVENVGNLVCPSLFDIGESLRIVCLSVTEGADKPEKYPVAFLEADCTAITKLDLLPHVDFDRVFAKGLIGHIHSEMPIFETSAKTREGLDALAAHIGGLWK
jgi:hydrogenase nickel incorporation protein HypB